LIRLPQVPARRRGWASLTRLTQGIRRGSNVRKIERCAATTVKCRLLDALYGGNLVVSSLQVLAAAVPNARQKGTAASLPWASDLPRIGARCKSPHTQRERDAIARRTIGEGRW